jgi:hypothetical protein
MRTKLENDQMLARVHADRQSSLGQQSSSAAPSTAAIFRKPPLGKTSGSINASNSANNVVKENIPDIAEVFVVLLAPHPPTYSDNIPVNRSQPSLH